MPSTFSFFFAGALLSSSLSFFAIDLLSAGGSTFGTFAALAAPLPLAALFGGIISCSTIIRKNHNKPTISTGKTGQITLDASVTQSSWGVYRYACIDSLLSGKAFIANAFSIRYSLRLVLKNTEMALITKAIPGIM